MTHQGPLYPTGVAVLTEPSRSESALPCNTAMLNKCFIAAGQGKERPQVSECAHQRPDPRPKGAALLSAARRLILDWWVKARLLCRITFADFERALELIAAKKV